MAIALLFAGVLLLVSSVRDQQSNLFTLIQGEFSGSNNFAEWILAIFLVGAIGYVPKLKPFSVALLSLVLLAIFLKKGTGFFSQLSSAVKGVTPTSAASNSNVTLV